MAKRSIADARALVTGASSGIGREIARELARGSARLLITARREERLTELSDELTERGGDAHFVAGDIADAAFRHSLLKLAEEQLGALDILVNNAGVGAIGPFAQADPQRLRRHVDIVAVDLDIDAELPQRDQRHA